MADYKLEATDFGIYEIDIPADTVTTFELASSEIFDRSVRILVHTAGDPVYARTGTGNNPITIQDRGAQIIPDATYLDITVGPSETLAIICASPAKISVSRS